MPNIQKDWIDFLERSQKIFNLAAAERSVSNLIEASQRLDVWFTQRRFLLSQQRPELVMKEVSSYLETFRFRNVKL